MTDIKEKLKQLKKEREARSKSQRITETWEEMEKKENLSTKEKLQQLIDLTREKKAQKPQTPSFEPLPREPLQFFENPYSLDIRYGKIVLSSGLDISGDVLTCLSKDSAFETLDLSTALFIDLETTGLSSGVGVVPFNVGMGYYKNDKFYVAQYFLGDLAEEERMIKELGQFFEEMNFQSVVTYNGKSFDIPLLETRFILYRKPLILCELPHLDFLYSARSLWGHKYENCRLFHLAHELLEADRSEDIPSAEIPLRYFQYLQTGNFDLIEPILYHNQEDILSLLGVVITGALIFSEDSDA
ncbi:MAG: ribonuclease H-like domain-containing protein, partial [Candidatus Aminicenantes bacterium]|nr:ribonuclease H-like domain-containing protein [Candidatus Aminicenantes bacterium]